MFATGVSRKIDELGRLVIPIEIRRALDMGEKEAVEFYVDGDKLIVKKYRPFCIFCGSDNLITQYKGKNLCASCLEGLKSK